VVGPGGFEPPTYGSLHRLLLSSPQGVLRPIAVGLELRPVVTAALPG